VKPPDPPLTDGAILLRPPEEGDVDAMTAACQEEEIQRWTPAPRKYTKADAHKFVRNSAERWATGAGAPFAVVNASDSRFLGLICVRVIHMHIERSIGQFVFWVAREARGRGVATRALVLVSRWAFDGMGLARLQLVTEPENVPSQRVAERAGFRREGILRSYIELHGSRRDAVMYGLLPADVQGPS
jgi:RimJ/RimL family protein N-acetyltransferase